MTAEYPHGDEPLIPMPALSLPALRQAVATVAPSRLPEFFQEIQDAFTQAGRPVCARCPGVAALPRLQRPLRLPDHRVGGMPRLG